MADTIVKQFLENRDVLVGFIFALTRQYDVAEEVFQEVSLVILEEAGKKTQVGNFMAWVREIARRRVADYYRKAARRQAVIQLSDSLTDVVCLSFAESDSVLEQHQRRMSSLLQCLERLTGRSREVIEGFYHHRKSLKQIGSEIGWQHGSVKVALSRARKALADCIQVRMQRPVQEAK